MTFSMKHCFDDINMKKPSTYSKLDLNHLRLSLMLTFNYSLIPITCSLRIQMHSTRVLLLVPSRRCSCVWRLEIFEPFRKAADEEKRLELEAAAAKEAEKHLENGLDENNISSFDLILPIVLELSDKVVEMQNRTPEVKPFTPARMAALMQKDCFLVFRSLCKLSMKPLPGWPSRI